MRSPAKSFAVRLVLAAFCFISCAALSKAQSLPGYQAPDKPKTVEPPIATKVERGQAPLAKLYGHLKPDAAKIKRLPPLKPSAKQKKSDKLLQIGEVRMLGSDLNPLTDSAIYSVAEGDVRVAAVVSQGAVYTRIHFKGFALPTGARVFVYSAANPDVYFGPYEGGGPWGDGMFWSPPLPGDQVVIEYRTPTGTVPGDVPFKVHAVGHIYKAVSSPNDPAGACNLEVPAEWANAAKSVGQLTFVSGGSLFACTGTLLNDSNTSVDHHLLTANHCISTQSEAQSVTVYWNYNTGDTPPIGTPTTNGANLLVTAESSDFTLLRLTGALPAGLFFSGWDADPIGAGTSVTGIHHPQGSHKRISFGATNSNCDNTLPGPCANFTGVTWNPSGGTTEEGSSGSGIWTGPSSNPTLVGTLTGGFASCSTPTESDYYGRFSVTYPSVASFLEGTNCVTAVSPTSQNFAGSGGSGSFNVSAPGGCNWTAVSTDSFVSITAGASGTGNGAVNFSVAANSGPQRSASIVVGGQIFNITQDGGGACAATPISIGQTVNGNLSTSDCPLDDGTYYDVYSFSGTAGQQISVLMTSNEFDTFLFLNRPDGSVLGTNDDGGGGTNSRIPAGSGFITLPTTGTYTIWANAFDASDTTGAYAITLNGTAPPTPRTLTVASSNPNSGVNITVSPADNNGASNGTTQFTRTYSHGVTVTLTAPATAGGNVFQKWQKDGVDVIGESLSTSVLMDANHTMTAVYGPAPTRTLTVASLNPNSGVAITVSPNDNTGNGNGTTQFTRTYNQNTTVTLRASATTPEGNPFKRWLKNGSHFNGLLDAIVTMSSDVTMTAEYYIRPKIYGEENNPSAAAALNSVTFLRGPFQILDPHNFAADGHTRIIIFTNDLGLTNPPLSDASVLRVEASGLGLPIEAYGPLTGTPGLTGSYIVVKLPPGLPTATSLQLVVWLFGISSDPKTLTIAP